MQAYAGNIGPTELVKIANDRNSIEHVAQRIHVASKALGMDFIWMSPPCTEYSIAKGARPRCAEVMQLAISALEAAFMAKPRLIVMENSDALLQHPMLGKIIDACRQHGYGTHHAVIKSEDVGSPSARKRLYIAIAPLRSKAFDRISTVFDMGEKRHADPRTIIDRTLPLTSPMSRSSGNHTQT